MRRIYSPTYGLLEGVVPVEAGGTAARSVSEAVTNLDLLTWDKVGVANGVAGLDSNGLLPVSSLPSDVGTLPTVDGPATVINNNTNTYQITNYDSSTTYVVSATGGTASVNSSGAITFVAGAAGAATITVNGVGFAVTVATPVPVAPSILAPTNGATNQLASVTFTSSAFAMLNGLGTDTHQMSDWQLATDAGFTNVVQSSIGSTTNLTSWTVTGLSVSTTYYVRVRYKGTTYGYGSYSATSSFSTKTAFWATTQQAKLVASDGAANDFFGSSIALSSDGNTCAVGAYGDDTSRGSAYIFTRSGTTWTQQAKLVASDGAAYVYFGYSIALSSDGNTCAVGAYGNDVGANTDQGSAYVFTRSGSTWTQQAKLVASDGAANDLFGLSIALSSDGNTCAVGAFRDDVGANTDQGSAYIFTRSGSTWTQQAKLVASDGAMSAYFGYSIALSSDGNTCAVGAYMDDVIYLEQGSTYIFTRSGSTWTQQAKLTASDGAANDLFGLSIALSSDGNTCAVGAYMDDSVRGSAYIFTRSGSTWTQQAKLVASDGAMVDYFGRSVALSSDGNTCAVGAIGVDVGANTDQGSAYIFTRSGSAWTQRAKLVASDGAMSDRFGISIALSSDGNTCAVGAWGDDIGANTDQGSAYIFA